MKVYGHLFVSIVINSLPSFAIDLSSNRIKEVVGDGGQNKGKFESKFFSSKENKPCTTCDFCTEFHLGTLFDPKGPGLCVDCKDADNDCDSVSIYTTFEKEWVMKYLSLRSSGLASNSEDPGQIYIQGSNDHDSAVDPKYDMLHQTNSVSFSNRSKSEYLVVDNNEAYSTYVTTFVMKTASKIRIGYYGIVNDYARRHMTKIFNDVTGISLKEPTNWVKSEAGGKCLQVCSDLGLLCNSNKQTDVNSFEKIKDIANTLGYTCANKDLSRTYEGVPFIGSDNTCIYVESGGKSTCTGNKYDTHSPFCYCEAVTGPWIKNESGAFCEDACKALGGKCNAAKQTDVNSFAKIKEIAKTLGHTCADKDVARTYAGVPFFTNHGCVYVGSGGKSTCTGNKYAHHYPFCYCDGL